MGTFEGLAGRLSPLSSGFTDHAKRLIVRYSFSIAFYLIISQINENLTYSEKILMYMRRCCLCWICDSCTGADPEESREKDWQRKSNRYRHWKRQGALGAPASSLVCQKNMSECLETCFKGGRLSYLGLNVNSKESNTII